MNKGLNACQCPLSCEVLHILCKEVLGDSPSAALLRETEARVSHFEASELGLALIFLDLKEQTDNSLDIWVTHRAKLACSQMAVSTLTLQPRRTRETERVTALGLGRRPQISFAQCPSFPTTPTYSSPSCIFLCWKQERFWSQRETEGPHTPTPHPKSRAGRVFQKPPKTNSLPSMPSDPIKVPLESVQFPQSPCC